MLSANWQPFCFCLSVWRQYITKWQAGKLAYRGLSSLNKDILWKTVYSHQITKSIYKEMIIQIT